MRSKFLSIFILALVALTANAQDDFNPVLPGEPNAHYKVMVEISNAAAGSVYGGGSFVEGTQVTISRDDAYFSQSSTVFYRFKCWTLNGEEYKPAGTSYSFTYTVGRQNVVFVAVYEEVNPEEVTSRVFVSADPSDACSFNISSGSRYFEGNSVYLYYNLTSNAFKFNGWYEGDNLISSSRFFYYNVGKDDAYITARFTYDPMAPSEPSGNQDNIDLSVVGDMNNDGTVNVQDIAIWVNMMLNDIDKEKADVNGDGVFDIKDVLIIHNKSLKK